MATADPKAATVTAKPAIQAPEPEAEELDEILPEVERVNIGGLELEKTLLSGGQCKTKLIKEPMIAAELVRATSASQRNRGH